MTRAKVVKKLRKMPGWLTLPELAEKTQMSYGTILTMAQKGRLPGCSSFRSGSRTIYRVDEEKFLAWVRANMVAG